MSDRVKLGLKFVANLGNFESLHLDASYESDVRPGETADDAFERVYDEVESQLVKRFKKAKEDLT